MAAVVSAARLVVGVGELLVCQWLRGVKGAVDVRCISHLHARLLPSALQHPIRATGIAGTHQREQASKPPFLTLPSPLLPLRDTPP